MIYHLSVENKETNILITFDSDYYCPFLIVPSQFLTEFLSLILHSFIKNVSIASINVIVKCDKCHLNIILTQ